MVSLSYLDVVATAHEEANTIIEIASQVPVSNLLHAGNSSLLWFSH